MKWTKKLPKKQGWYWWTSQKSNLKNEDFHKIIYVFKIDGIESLGCYNPDFIDSEINKEPISFNEIEEWINDDPEFDSGLWSTAKIKIPKPVIK